MKKCKVINRTVKLPKDYYIRKAKYSRWKELDKVEVPNDMLDTVASLLYSEIKEYFADESAQKDFEKWKKLRIV